MNHDPLDLEGQAASETALTERQRIARENEIGDLVWLMSIKRGRRVVRRLLEQAGIYQLSYRDSALETAFNEGQRNAGLRLMAAITANCPEQYALLLKEQADHVD